MTFKYKVGVLKYFVCIYYLLFLLYFLNRKILFYLFAKYTLLNS